MQHYDIRPGQRQVFRRRTVAFFSICLVAMLMLLIRSAWLQIVKGDLYSLRSEQNRMRVVPIIPPRGEVFDRDMKAKLITNKKSLCITVVPASLPTKRAERDALLWRLAVVLEMPTNRIVERLAKDKWDVYSPKLIKENVDFRAVTRIAESQHLFPGVFWENRPIRVYTLTNTLAHLLGYTGAISQEELVRHAKRGYRAGSLIGKTGIEQVYDMELRGEEGIREREVDVHNFVTYERVRKDPVHGRPLVLTIDARLQNVAQTAMAGLKGAVIVTKPATGEVLAILSNPGFDANMFYSRINQEEFQKILSDPRKPLLNRVTQALYPPSSIFKLVTAIAGLEGGKISVSAPTHYCDGGIVLGDRPFKCWFGRHGSMTLLPAIMNSCNVWFYRSSLDIKPENILYYARMFGMGRRTGLDLAGEVEGFVPTRAWKNKTAGRPWLDGDTLNLAIGQGDLLVTPLQVNALTCAIANEGIAYKPFLMKEVRSMRHGDVVERNRGKHVLFTVDVSRETFRTIREGMEQVVKWGTGQAAALPRVRIAGKTGSAQNAQELSHAWFTCFAPMDAADPEEMIAITVVCENAGGGGAVAAPVAAAILRARFEGKDARAAVGEAWRAAQGVRKNTD